ncbi:helix-turn-helix transcriptional regulator, partial [Aeromonas hydrophila]|uniref:helix-turn-helix transcriptional regulator n=1 Tax=Aeromonas hydrophila TaxID=644 RepID=UPI003EC4E70F
QPEASSPGAKDENTGAGLCRSRLVVQERLGHYNETFPKSFKIGQSSIGWFEHDVDSWLILRSQSGVINF